MCEKSSTKSRSSGSPKHQMNELNWNQTNFQRIHNQSSAQTIPKQAVDILDMANSVDVPSNTYRKQLALDV